MSPILERLYQLMHQRGVNAKQVSETLHLSNSAFTDWKKGKANPGVDALTKLADYFDVTLDYLILGKESAPAGETVPPASEHADHSVLDSSSFLNHDLYIKFLRLPPEHQGKVMAYIDGMLAVLPVSHAQAPDIRQETSDIQPESSGIRLETPDIRVETPDVQPESGAVSQGDGTQSGFESAE